MRQEQFLGEELSDAENCMKTARFEVVPCGLEATVSYGTGAAKGPAAIIAASHQLERLTNGKVPCADGIFTHAPIDCGQDIEAVMGDLRALTGAIIGRGHIPVTLGGEHSVSYGAVMGVVDALNAPLGLVHVDAHADFRNAYQGHKHSHASIMHLLAQEGLPMASFGVGGEFGQGGKYDNGERFDLRLPYVETGWTEETDAADGVETVDFFANLMSGGRLQREADERAQRRAKGEDEAKQ